MRLQLPRRVFGEGWQHALNTFLNRGRVQHFSDFSPGMQLKGHSTIHHESLAIKQRNGGTRKRVGEAEGGGGGGGGGVHYHTPEKQQPNVLRRLLASWAQRAAAMHTATFEKGNCFDQLNVARRQHWLAVSPKRLERRFEIQLVAVGKLKLPVRSVAAQMNAGDMELIKGSCLCHRMGVIVRYNTDTLT